MADFLSTARPTDADDPSRGSATEVRSWRPARKFPETYPGPCPDHHYLLADHRVLPVAGVDGSYQVRGDGGATEPLDSFLGRHGLPALADRFPVLAYGANRNPATMSEKLRNYHYVSPSDAVCVPVFRATLPDADVAACGLHGQGYLYGELLLDSPYSTGAALDVRVALLDADQLRVLNDSEGIRQDLYSAALIPRTRVSGPIGIVTPIGYVTNARVWTSPVAGSPLGFRAVSADNRRFPALTSAEILDHALDALALRAGISSVTGLANGPGLGHELTKYLNGQWWYHFHTGDAPIAGYTRVLEMFASAMAASLLDGRTRDRLAAAGLLVPTDRLYHPDRGLTLTGLQDR